MTERLKTDDFWNIFPARQSLIDTGGINPDDIEHCFTHLEFKSRKVIISVDPGVDMIVSIEGQDDNDAQILMEGFSKAVEHKPFCKYNLQLDRKGVNNSFSTYEWDVVDPGKRLEILNRKQNVFDLVEISEKV